MKIAFGMLSLVLCALLNSGSAHAACGGGGYAPAPKSNSSSATYTSSSSTYKEAPNTSSVLDTSRFNNVSGKLHLTYEQATAVIKAMNDVRSSAKDSSDKSKEAAQKDFDKRLSEILKPEQFKEYQSNKNS